MPLTANNVIFSLSEMIVNTRTSCSIESLSQFFFMFSCAREWSCVNTSFQISNTIIWDCIIIHSHLLSYPIFIIHTVSLLSFPYLLYYHFYSPPILFHIFMSHFTRHMSHVICFNSHFTPFISHFYGTFHMSFITCYMSHVTFHMFQFTHYLFQFTASHTSRGYSRRFHRERNSA